MGAAPLTGPGLCLPSRVASPLSSIKRWSTTSCPRPSATRCTLHWLLPLGPGQSSPHGTSNLLFFFPHPCLSHLLPCSQTPGREVQPRGPASPEKRPSRKWLSRCPLIALTLFCHLLIFSSFHQLLHTTQKTFHTPSSSNPTPPPSVLHAPLALRLSPSHPKSFTSLSSPLPSSLHVP